VTAYERGLHEVADGVHAWLLPDGSWGWSNAGLVVADGESLLVDTLFDLHLTGEMLAAMAPITGAAPIAALVNTHANGDHCYGNDAVGAPTVIASAAAAREMDEVPPALMAGLVASAPAIDPLLGAWIDAAFGPFDFSGPPPRPPDTTFEGALSIEVGGREVRAIQVGPAHTAGDVVVHVPDAGVVLTGDIVFHRGTPIMWAGPIDGWLAACDTILELGPTTVVPGHGAVTDASGVLDARRYLAFVRDELTARFEAGMGYLEAARDVELGEWAELSDPGRIVVTAHTMHRVHDPAAPPADVVTLFTEMARFDRDLRAR
jgi:glyoxylase-like metal-dependent hydrolase (beta-lactamase superfamily II)